MWDFKFAFVIGVFLLFCIVFVIVLLSPFLNSEKLRERVHDVDEGVRQEVVSAIASAAKKDITNISDEMLTLIKDRTLDKKVSHSYFRELFSKNKYSSSSEGCIKQIICFKCFINSVYHLLYLKTDELTNW